MKRALLAVLVILGGVGGGAALAGSSGVSRNVVATGVSDRDIDIRAEAPVEVRHAIVHVDPGATSGWISWDGELVVTVKAGDLSYRNASERNRAASTFTAGASFLIPARSPFEVVNRGSDRAELHTVLFVPPGENLKVENKRHRCR